MQKLDEVNIRPQVTILSVLKHLNYKPYYALAEFVDNSIDSYLKNKEELKNLEGDDYKLVVQIEFNLSEDKIVIRDNAGGIRGDDFPRAFRAAEVPPDTSRLSEFGMGMKSAACWFSNSWKVRTKAFQEDIERTVSFDIDSIVSKKLDTLQIKTKKKPSKDHYTVISLLGIGKKMPVKNGQAKVKKHLASLYRQFIRDGVLELRVQNEILEYPSPKILVAPYYENLSGPMIEWRKEIDIEFSENLKVKGFVALMDPMSASNSGFALFRRGRVIEGSADKGEGFRPAVLSGSLGSHRYKRIFGELHLDGFNVSHTKDGFQWGDDLDTFLELLKEELDKDPLLPILKQADKYRVKESKRTYQEISQTVVENTANSIQGLGIEVDSVRQYEGNDETPQSLVQTKDSYFKEFSLSLNDCDWMVHVEVSYDESIADFIQVGDHLVPQVGSQNGFRNIGIRLSLTHPFMVQFASHDEDIIEPILRIAVALGLSEVVARETRSPISDVRKNLNELISGKLSKP